MHRHGGPISSMRATTKLLSLPLSLQFRLGLISIYLSLSCRSTSGHRRLSSDLPPPMNSTARHDFCHFSIDSPFRCTCPRFLARRTPHSSPVLDPQRGLHHIPPSIANRCARSMHSDYAGFTPVPRHVAGPARSFPPLDWATKGGPPGPCDLSSEAGYQPTAAMASSRIWPTGRIFFF
jgi:hypothetical protein